MKLGLGSITLTILLKYLLGWTISFISAISKNIKKGGSRYARPGENPKGTAMLRELCEVTPYSLIR